MATSNCGGLFPLESEIVRSITIGKDECHIVEFLHRNIFDILVHFGDVHTHALDGAYVRYSNRSGEENQLQDEPDQDSCHNSDSVMCAHNGPPVANAMDAGASGLRTRTSNQLLNVILCQPMAPGCQFATSKSRPSRMISIRH